MCAAMGIQGTEVAKEAADIIIMVRQPPFLHSAAKVQLPLTIALSK